MVLPLLFFLLVCLLLPAFPVLLPSFLVLRLLLARLGRTRLRLRCRHPGHLGHPATCSRRSCWTTPTWTFALAVPHASPWCRSRCFRPSRTRSGHPRAGLWPPARPAAMGHVPAHRHLLTLRSFLASLAHLEGQHFHLHGRLRHRLQGHLLLHFQLLLLTAPPTAPPGKSRAAHRRRVEGGRHPSGESVCPQPHVSDCESGRRALPLGRESPPSAAVSQHARDTVMLVDFSHAVQEEIRYGIQLSFSVASMQVPRRRVRFCEAYSSQAR